MAVQSRSVREILESLRNQPALVLLGMVLGAVALHLSVAGRADLSQDESHYALYGRHLDWSYFDHPPLVGWLQATAIQLGDSELALRSWAILLSILSAWLLHVLAREFFPQARWRAVIAYGLLQGALMMHLLSLAVLPETLLVPLFLLAALLLHRALTRPRGRDWIWVGVVFGLAGLSKYTAITLVVSALAAVALTRRWDALRDRHLWLGLAIALAIVSPVLIWNLHNEWISIRYQLDHGSPDKPWSVERFAVSQLGQILAYSPLLYLAGIAAMVRGLVGPGSTGERLLACMAAPLLLITAWLSGYEETLPHWTAAAWTVLSLAAAGWLSRHWHRRWVRGLTWASAVYSGVLVVVVHSALLHPWLPYWDGRYPLADVLGWRDAAERARWYLERHASASEQDTAGVLIASNWSVASQLAWYAYPAPVQISSQRDYQISRWYGKPESSTQGVLVVPAKYQDKPHKNGVADFENCEHLEDVEIKLRSRVATSYRLYWCRSYRG